MKIHNLETVTIDDVYVSSEYIIAIESHLTKLKESSSVTPITKLQSYKYEGDFYGLLNEIGVKGNYFYVYLRVNDLVNSADYNGKNEYVITPNINEVERIVSIIETRNS